MNPKAISSNTTIEKQISHIVGTLLLNGTLTESPGLVHGKMGIAIFFFHYAQYTKNMLFADYALGLDYGNTESAIFPVMVRNEHYVKEAARILFEQGIYVNPISYPAVPEKLSRLRFSLTAMHTKEELDKTFSILENIRKKYKLAQI